MHQDTHWIAQVTCQAELGPKWLTNDNSSSGCIILLVDDVDGPDFELDVAVLAAVLGFDDDPSLPPWEVVFEAAALEVVVGAAEKAAAGNVGLTGPMEGPMEGPPPLLFLDWDVSGLKSAPTGPDEAVEGYKKCNIVLNRVHLFTTTVHSQ